MVDGKTMMQNGSYAGVIEAGDTRIVLSTKVTSNIIYMLTFLEREEALKADMNRSIEIEGGDCFFDAIARFFINELDRILERGLLKRYVRKEENLNYIRGKILVQENMTLNLGFKPKVLCEYHDLTYDNTENRIILRAVNLLIPLVRYSTEIKERLIAAQTMMLGEVSMDPGISSWDCDRISLDRLSNHYSEIIGLSKLILDESYVRSTERGSSKGFNFIVEMNQLFEDFVTEITTRVVEKKYPEYRVLRQTRMRTLDLDGKLLIKPDVVIQERNSGKMVMMLDAKYKRSLANSDVYQMSAYSLAVRDSISSCLVYPETEGVGDDLIRVSKQLFDERLGYIPILTRTLCISSQVGESYATFVCNAEMNLEKILASMLQQGEKARSLQVAGPNNIIHGAQIL
jgi:5-methylcytosine-specific restriction enzyme subunit McrC